MEIGTIRITGDRRATIVWLSGQIFAQLPNGEIEDIEINCEAHEATDLIKQAYALPAWDLQFAKPEYAVTNTGGAWLAYSEPDGHHMWTDKKNRDSFSREQLEALDDTLLANIGVETYFDNSGDDIGWGSEDGIIHARAVKL